MPIKGGYPKDDYRLPSVTQIIGDSVDKSNALCPWAANMVVKWISHNCVKDGVVYSVSEDDLNDARQNYRDVSQDALDIGSTVHEAIETWLKWGKEPVNPRQEVLAAFVAFLEFYDEHDMRQITVEYTVYGPYFAGTLDFYGWFEGKRYVIDFKTSKAHYIHEHGPQIAAYRSCIPDADGCGVLRLDKTTGYPDWKDYSKRYEKDLAEFQLMVPLYMHRHPQNCQSCGMEPTILGDD